VTKPLPLSHTVPEYVPPVPFPENVDAETSMAISKTRLTTNRHVNFLNICFFSFSFFIHLYSFYSNKKIINAKPHPFSPENLADLKFSTPRKTLFNLAAITIPRFRRNKYYYSSP
jgi:hypothetical protein